MKQKIAEEKGELENQTEKVPLPKPELKLRSYEPTTEELKEAKAEPAKPGEIETQIKVHVFITFLRCSIWCEVMKFEILIFP